MSSSGQHRRRTPAQSTARVPHGDARQLQDRTYVSGEGTEAHLHFRNRFSGRRLRETTAPLLQHQAGHREATTRGPISSHCHGRLREGVLHTHSVRRKQTGQASHELTRREGHQVRDRDGYACERLTDTRTSPIFQDRSPDIGRSGITTLYLYLYLNLYPYLNLYLPKNLPKAAWQKGYSELAWQRKHQIRPLNNVAGWITTADCYGLGGVSHLVNDEPQVSKSGSEENKL